MDAERLAPIRIWDAPTRIVHWTIALLVLVSWRTAEAGAMAWHYRSGYALLALLLFRLAWGFVGSDTARFSRFVRGPRAIRAYLAEGDAGVPGHSPLGALSVVAMLAALVAQVTLGLFAIDPDGLEAGPLADRISFDAARTAADLHELGFNILVALIALHVAAILFYWIAKRRNLVGAMVTGRGPAVAPATPLRFARPARALLVLALAILAAFIISRGLRL